jgi:TonB family protein
MKGNNLPAPDTDGPALDALGFSVAGDIVELLVLTSDDSFLQTLREAVGGARRLWHVPSGDKVSDLLMAGEVGILVLDVQALIGTPAVFVAQIKRQFPDLVVLAAGDRETETSLARLISVGSVYRFIHKPLSPGRAKSFADAAVKKYEDQRRRAAAAAPPANRGTRSNRGALGLGAIGALGVIAAAIWTMYGGARNNAGPRHAVAAAPAMLSPDAPATGAGAGPGNAPGAGGLNAPAGARLNAPPGAGLNGPAGAALNAPPGAAGRNGPAGADLAAASPSEGPRTAAGAGYTAAAGASPRAAVGSGLPVAPASTAAAGGPAAVRERLLAAAETALLEDRLDDAAQAIEAARKAGVESGHVTFLTAQLAKSRELVKTVQAAAHGKSSDEPTTGDDSAALPAKPPDQRLDDGHVDREADSQASRALARRGADADARATLLKNGSERLQQDRLVEPAGDSAKYYLLTLRGQDPSHPGLAAAMQVLGIRMVAKARDSLWLAQYDAARGWLDEAAAIGFFSPESNSLRHDLDAAVAARELLANVVSAGSLKLVKSVQPSYPRRANAAKTEGWVELDFTVAEDGAVKDIAVHAASIPGVFEDAAIGALSQWRYQPVVRDAKPAPQRARIRMRFALADQ